MKPWNCLIFMTSIFVIVNFVPQARAADQLRYFESIDNQAKVWFLEFKDGASVKALVKISGVRHDAADRTLEFKQDHGGKNPPFTSQNSVGFSFDESELYRRVNGTDKQIWQFYGVKGKSDAIDMVELAAPAGTTAELLRNDYMQKEQGMVPEAKDGAKISAMATALMAKDCKGKIALQYSATDFSGNAKPPIQRVLAAAMGVADLCRADEDYRKALVEAGKIALASSSDATSEYVKGSKPPLLKIAKDGPNTRSRVARVLRDNL